MILSEQASQKLCNFVLHDTLAIIVQVCNKNFL